MLAFNAATEQVAYMVAALFFIFGLKRLSGVRTARQGNLWAALGMAAAIAITLLLVQAVTWWVLIGGVLAGTIVGWLLATRVQMTAMPELVALPDADQALARGLLAVDRDRVLEVAEQDVGPGRDVGRLGDHLLVREVQEVDHPGRRERDLGERFGRPDGEGLEEVTGIAHEAPEHIHGDRFWRHEP
jgi:hypothetical protein